MLPSPTRSTKMESPGRITISRLLSPGRSCCSGIRRTRSMKTESRSRPPWTAHLTLPVTPTPGIHIPLPAMPAVFRGLHIRERIFRKQVDIDERVLTRKMERLNFLQTVQKAVQIEGSWLSGSSFDSTGPQLDTARTIAYCALSRMPPAWLRASSKRRSERNNGYTLGCAMNPLIVKRNPVR